LAREFATGLAGGFFTGQRDKSGACRSCAVRPAVSGGAVAPAWDFAGENAKRSAAKKAIAIEMRTSWNVVERKNSWR